VLVIAHRGASGEFLEGTQLAYHQALLQGADGFECDLRLTKDDQIICFHDRNTQRLFNIDLEIAKSSYAQLIQRVPLYLFEELLKLAIENKKDLVLEFKHPVPTAGRIEWLTHKLLKKYRRKIVESGIEITLISFSYFATLRNLILARGLYQSALLINNKFYAKITPTKIAAVDIKLLRDNSSLFDKYKKGGKKLYIWTVNNESDLKLCERLAAAMVITDYPKKIRLLLLKIDQSKN
jgi:glycerophosphoryl diester phosphodiesterase